MPLRGDLIVNRRSIPLKKIGLNIKNFISSRHLRKQKLKLSTISQFLKVLNSFKFLSEGFSSSYELNSLARPHSPILILQVETKQIDSTNIESLSEHAKNQI